MASKKGKNKQGLDVEGLEQKKKKLTSPVYEFFTEIEDDPDNFKCKQCNVTRSVRF